MDHFFLSKKDDFKPFLPLCITGGGPMSQRINQGLSEPTVVIHGPPNVWGSGSIGKTLEEVWLLLIKPHEKKQFSFLAFKIIGDATGLMN